MRLIGSRHINSLTGCRARSLQASVTIEAALGLPIFIFVMLSLAFWIMVLRTQEMVNCSLINAANTMAVQYYSISGLDKVNQNAGDSLTSTKTDFNYINGTNIMNDFYNSLEKYNNEVSNNTAADPKNIEAYILTVWHMYESIYNEGNADPMYGNNGIALFKSYLINEFYKRESASSYNDSLALNEKKIAANQLLSSYSVIGGFDGIEFKDPVAGSWSSAFNPEADNNFITVTVKYEVNVPFPYSPLAKIPLSQSVKVRVWGTGDNN